MIEIIDINICVIFESAGWLLIKQKRNEGNSQIIFKTKQIHKAKNENEMDKLKNTFRKV